MPLCGHVKKTQPKEVALNISEQYQIEIFKQKLSFGDSPESLCMASKENFINQNSMKRNVSLSMSTCNTHCLYIHCIFTYMYTRTCIVLYCKSHIIRVIIELLVAIALYRI